VTAVTRAEKDTCDAYHVVEAQRLHWGCVHELSIAESILEAVRTECARRPEKRVRPVRVGLKIGEMAAVDEDALTFCFDAMVKGTEYDGLKLAIKIVKQQRRCAACSNEFAVVDYNAVCTACGSSETKAISGDELDFEFLEVETDEQ